MVFYTVLGAIIGGAAAHFYCKLRGIPTGSTGGMPSFPKSGSILVMAGVLVGAGVGFGVGVNAITNGTYRPWNLLTGRF